MEKLNSVVTQTKHRTKKSVLKFLEIEEITKLQKPLYDRAKKAIEEKTDNKIELAKVRDYAVLSLLYGGALRISEALNLKMYNLNMKEGYVIIVGSKGNDRVVDLPEPTLKILQTWLDIRPDWENNEYVFCHIKTSPKPDEECKPLSRANYNKLMKKLAIETNTYLEGGKKVEYPHPHTIRHSRAMNLRDNNVELDVIQGILGHSNISTTQIYAQARRKELRQAQMKCVDGIETF